MKYTRNHLYYVLYLSLISTLITCDSSTSTTPATTETKIQEKIDSIPNTPKKPVLDEATLIRPQGQKWTGKIDGKYAIDMTFQVLDSFDNYATIEGSYAYRSSNKTIPLQGKLFFNNQKVILSHNREDVLNEQFEGNISNNQQQLKGRWKKVRKNKELSFEMNNVMTSQNTTLFLHALSEAVAKEDAEAPSAQSVGLDQKGIYIEALSAWHLEHDFYAGDFSASSWYESTARNSDYNVSVGLVQIDFKDLFVVLVSQQGSTEEFENGKLSDEAPEVSEETSHNVWMYYNNKPIDIFVEQASDAQTPIYAMFKDNNIIIIDKATKKQVKFFS